MAGTRHDLDQHLLALAVELGAKNAQPRRVAAGVCHRGHQSRPDHVVGGCEDRNRRRRLLRGANCHIPDSYNDIDLGFDQLRRNFRKLLIAQSKSARIDRQILALDEPKPPKPVE